MQKYRVVSDLNLGWTEVVKFLILANVTIFAVQQIFGLEGYFAYTFGLVPVSVAHGAVWQLVTYMFLHGGIGHIFFNMLALWMFGSMLERYWGSGEFLKYYLITGIGGGLCYFLFNMNSSVPTVGASGAIYGLLTAYAVLFPDNIIYIWFVIPLRAKWFAIIFGAIEFFSSFSSGSSIAHLAHLGGMVIGYVYLKRYKLFGHSMSGWKEKRERRAAEKEAQEIEAIRREVDDLLDKINRVGMDGLTKSEQKRLEKASKILREKEWR